MKPPIYTYTAGDAGLFVNSYLVELEAGIAAVDGNLLNSDVRAFRSRLDALKKPLLAVFITHPHPDHFNGISTLTDGLEVPIYATADVTRVIAETADAKRAQWGPVYGDEWPEKTVHPTNIVADGETVTVGGLDFRCHDLGPGESASESVWVVDGAGVAFVGDLAYNGMHCYNADGASGAWLAQLDRASVLLQGETLYPGHGAPGRHELLDRQRQYLLMFREVLARVARDGAVSEEATVELEQRMTRFLPDAPLAWLVGLSAPAVAAELAATHASDVTA